MSKQANQMMHSEIIHTTAFTGVPLSYCSFVQKHTTNTSPQRRPRSQFHLLPRFPQACVPSEESSQNSDEIPIEVEVTTPEDDVDETPPPRTPFVQDNDSVSKFWERFQREANLKPLTEQEKQVLRTQLPGPVAEFLIKRAEDADKLRTAPSEQSEILRKTFKDFPPDMEDWEAELEAGGEFSEYVYETSTGPPQFRRKGSVLFGGGDGIPDKLPDAPPSENNGENEDDTEPATRKLMSLFVGNVGGIDEQAGSLGYLFAGLFALWILFKIVAALVSFFVSFTFSFFAIFALSAGIFMVFFFLRF